VLNLADAVVGSFLLFFFKHRQLFRLSFSYSVTVLFKCFNDFLTRSALDEPRLGRVAVELGRSPFESFRNFLIVFLIKLEESIKDPYEVAQCEMGELAWLQVNIVLKKVHGVLNHQKSIDARLEDGLVHADLHFYPGLMD
jgi:hypothetical protein